MYVYIYKRKIIYKTQPSTSLTTAGDKRVALQSNKDKIHIVVVMHTTPLSLYILKPKLLKIMDS